MMERIALNLMESRLHPHGGNTMSQPGFFDLENMHARHGGHGETIARFDDAVD